MHDTVSQKNAETDYLDDGTQTNRDFLSTDG